MRRAKNFTITKESLKDQVKGRRFNPCLEITFRDRAGLHRHKISAGYSDEVHVFKNHGLTVVLSFNLKLGYVGLEAFQGGEKINDVYLCGSEMLAAFGEDDLKPSKMAGILSEWL
ncbi:MAG: hypothetical protein WCJ37_16445 [Syntrophus sp. (in: bacteria)]